MVRLHLGEQNLGMKEAGHLGSHGFETEGRHDEGMDPR